MTELADYTDARELIPEFEQHRCPYCGTMEWFKQTESRHDPRDYWYCQSCSNTLMDYLEYPCPECDIRMIRVQERFECRNETCGFDHETYEMDTLIDRLSSNDYAVRGKPGVLMGKCPLCHDSHGINGGPDGELECSNCNGFYAAQYSDTWYCYAIWMKEPDTIRVRTFD